eukprot:1139430-Pelagomonas_calceolata.AAC.2
MARCGASALSAWFLSLKGAVGSQFRQLQWCPWADYSQQVTGAKGLQSKRLTASVQVQWDPVVATVHRVWPRMSQKFEIQGPKADASSHPCFAMHACTPPKPARHSSPDVC